MIQCLPAGLKAVILGGVVAGTFDITYAFIFYGMRGIPATRILQSVASSFSGRLHTPAALHQRPWAYCCIFSSPSPQPRPFYLRAGDFPGSSRRAFVSGVIFGLCVFLR